MADVPDEAILRGVEHVVERNGQLDDAQAGAQMPAGDRHGIDHLLAQFVCDLTQLAGIQLTQVLGGMNFVKQRRF